MINPRLSRVYFQASINLIINITHNFIFQFPSTINAAAMAAFFLICAMRVCSFCRVWQYQAHLPLGLMAKFPGRGRR
jgi:hypothetical protein